MTWEELAVKIAAMTAEKRRKQAKFITPTDNFKVYPICLYQAVEEPIVDEDGDRVEAGEWYLEP